MENILNADHLQEVLFSSSDQRVSRQISLMEREGKIRKIAPRVYSSNLTDSPEEIIKRNLLYILGKLYPGAVLSHRSAVELKPTNEGHLFITHSYTKKIPLPGITLRFLEGKGPVEGDPIISGGLYASQNERALLENLQISRRSGEKSKSLGINYVEERVEKIALIKGDAGLHELRQRSREIAEVTGLEDAFLKLDQIISKRLIDKPSKIFESPSQMARTFGPAYDPNRQRLFEALFAALRSEEFQDIPDRNITSKSLRNIGLLEAWFSCQFEGIAFGYEDALLAVESDRPLPNRIVDSQILIHLFRLLIQRNEMTKVPQTPYQFIEFMQSRHKNILRSSPNWKPGDFRDENQFDNQAFTFDHQLIRGSLNRAYELYQALRHPFAKAAFLFFVIHEIKPFYIGNGLIARAMMNAELIHASQSRIIFPTSRQDLVTDALRLFTHKGDPVGYLDALQQIRMLSSNVFGEDLSNMLRVLA